LPPVFVKFLATDCDILYLVNLYALSMMISSPRDTILLLLIILLAWTTSGFSQGVLQLSASVTPTVCGQGGSVTFHPSGGTPPYKFALGNRRFQSSSYLPTAGPFVDTAWVQDATGALAFNIVTINNTYPLVYPYQASAIDPSGCTTADGQLTIAVNEGTPPFQYSLDRTNYQPSPTFSNLTPGIYVAFVKDANGCIGTAFLPLASLHCKSFGEGTNSNSCNNNGYFTVDPDLGIPPPIKYSIDGVNYQTNPTFSGLPPGRYPVNIIDGNGGSYLWTTYLYPLCTLTPTATVVNADCGSQDGSIMAQVTDGFPPYQYSIDGVNYQLGNTFTGLAAGNYTVLVKDGAGTIAAANASVASNCPTLTATATAAMCGNADGTITCFPGSLGTSPYQYSIDGIHFQSSGFFSGLPVGNYTVTMRDANNFTAETTVGVPNTCITVAATPSASFCSQADGALAVTVSGGTSPYLYSIDGVNFQTSGSFTSLAAATYTVTVKDAAGNIATSYATITNIAGPSLSVQSSPATCAGNDGSLALTGAGGTPPFQYSLDNATWQTSNGFAGLTPGNYLPYIKDAIGCIALFPATVTLTNDLSASAGNAQTICEGKSVTLNASSNGSGFTWSPITGLNNPNILQPSANPSTTTTYTLTSTRGVCQQQAPVTVTIKPAPIPNAGQDTTVCYGESVQLNGSGGLSYTWSPATGLNNPTISDPIVQKPDQSISYQLSVTDQNSCSSLQPATVTVHVTPPAELSTCHDTSVLTGEPLQLQAVDVNNSGFTTYNWTPTDGLNSPLIATPIATITTSTTYTVTAQTPAGCEATATLNIKVYYSIGLFVPNAFTPNGDGHNDILKVIPYGIRQLQYFAIFNRWGQRIFYTENPSQGWDGTINGQPQPSGPFVWMASGIDLNGRLIERKGSTVLIR
jgi:gliding motility-associated-like protein